MIKTIPEHLILVDLSSGPDDILFELYCDVDLEFSFRNKLYKVTIPKGFRTNFASVPKKFRNVISNVSMFNKCYLLHDYIYSKDCLLSFSKSDADVMLRRNLEDFGMDFVDRWTVYFSVKYFAKKHWKS